MALGLIQYVVFRRNLGTQRARRFRNPLPSIGIPSRSSPQWPVVVLIRRFVMWTGLVTIGEPLAGDHRSDHRRYMAYFRS